MNKSKCIIHQNRYKWTKHESPQLSDGIFLRQSTIYKTVVNHIETQRDEKFKDGKRYPRQQGTKIKWCPHINTRQN